MIPTDKAAIEGLLKLIQPIESTDERIPDIQWIELGEAAFEAREALQRLLAGETREADKPAGVPVAELETLATAYENMRWGAFENPAKHLRSLIKRFKDPHHG